MFHCYIAIVFLVLCITCDIRYFLRTLFTVLSGRLYEKVYFLNDVTTIYGLCTFQDCDIFFKSIRIARLVREIDFARYHFYDRTGIYKRSKELGIKSLQGSTLTVTMDPVPLFSLYKINTKLIYWDDRSLFFEHEVITLRDGKVRCLLISRQYAIGQTKETIPELLKGLSGSDYVPSIPRHIECWLESMRTSSVNLRK
ncbi:protein THEM6-like [Zerene cesonia]|uniref:protein THEM6-like n=1 Tax=Zerene cesonia TaxID=33412 RepID=UPI0018E539AB|nr:protein THEM6-like [Zerene cesonia]